MIYHVLLPHFTQSSFLLPKPQPLHKAPGVLLLPTHFPHLQQLSFLLPKPQLLQRQAAALWLPTHLPHLQQLSFLLPNPQLLHKTAIYLPIVNIISSRLVYKNLQGISGGQRWRIVMKLGLRQWQTLIISECLMKRKLFLQMKKISIIASYLKKIKEFWGEQKLQKVRNVIQIMVDKPFVLIYYWQGCVHLHRNENSAKIQKVQYLVQQLEGESFLPSTQVPNYLLRDFSTFFLKSTVIQKISLRKTTKTQKINSFIQILSIKIKEIEQASKKQNIIFKLSLNIINLAAPTTHKKIQNNKLRIGPHKNSLMVSKTHAVFNPKLTKLQQHQKP